MVNFSALGESLLFARKDLHMTQADIASRAGVSIWTVQRVEAGKGGSVGVAAFQRILYAYGWTLEASFGIFVGGSLASPDEADIVDELFSNVEELLEVTSDMPPIFPE